ncbi:MAG: general stress protein CsbD [Bacteroidales bacterium]|nr:MAG: general stress protein CsbD [Bacteroidales bacterium]
MKTIELNETWREKKNRLKERFIFLTDNDLKFEEGKREEMFEELRIKLGKTKQELLNIIVAL